MQHLVILRVKPDATEEEQAQHRKAEAAMVWELITSDVVRSIHFIPGPGVALHVEAKDEQEAETYINRLPMVEAGVVGSDVLPLRPFTGLTALFESAQ
jgi:hypothetical protein